MQPGLAARNLGMEMRRDADLEPVERRGRRVVEADEMEAGGRTCLMAALAGAIVEQLDQGFRRASQRKFRIVERG
ncbi:hypothetical protein [Mesorhizobium sp. M2A.F.Ca.ET.046.03.2.1]|uniref:hypothetical protein n=1 Tax=Mesorhizobium sp. M2A.F.Ca.ET.046.03.2.1 TaxID=2493674 RepID=UPI001FE10802|nr:hypothetical protein [Mesorhizobium sp. M2A.F.Ca.ET.046.03.2.1]